jgi:hypothetical protein
MQVPYEVRFISGQKGHGVFALEDIRQGRVIYRLQSDQRATVVGDDLLQGYVDRAVLRNRRRIGPFSDLFV